MGFDKSVMAARIRAKRAELDMTQQQLADLVGVNITTIVGYEDPNGFTPGGDKIWGLADALGTDPAWLMGWH